MAYGSVAVGLAGGAAKGLGNLGALKALEEFNLRPTAIAGTSAGALVGGLYAAGKTVAELEALLSGLTQRDVRKLVDLTWAPGSFVAGRKLEEFLYDLVGDVRVEELDLPFVATAVDIRSGTGLYLNRGRLVDAIRASISVPGVFEPVSANGGYLVDGGVRLNLPLEVLDQFHPEVLIGINITPRYSRARTWKAAEIQRDDPPDDSMSLWERIREFTGVGNANQAKKADTDLPERPSSGDETPGTAYLLSRVFEFIMYEASQAEVERARPDFVVNLDMEPIEVWEFWKGPEAVELGYTQTVAAIETFNKRSPMKGWWLRRARRWARRI
ncbi:MAG: patatin-like phospholipase family protein [Spirochaetales bacterium]